jgi:phosphoribosylformylglycinamidine cyclo-ligase
MNITIWGNSQNFYDTQKDILSEYGGKICEQSFKNSPFVEIQKSDWHFRAERSFTLKNLPEWYTQTIGSDGIGTKVVLADTIQIYNTLANDLVAMWVDDIARYGWLPLIVSNVSDIKWAETEEHINSFKEALNWLSQVAREQDLIVLSWETASLWECIGSPNKNANFPFNWSATFLWASHEKLKITGEKLHAWNILVALKQDGFRSNGISKVRKGFEYKYGKEWYTNAPKKEITKALEPSKVYARAISEANGWYNNWEPLVNITAISHLSWGSFQSKFYEPFLLKHWLSATFDNLYQIPEITKKCINWLIEWWETVTLEDSYQTWWCGQGMIVALEDIQNAEEFIKICNTFWVEGQIAWKIQETKKWKNPSISISVIE